MASESKGELFHDSESKGEHFHVSGPLHLLSAVDWKNPYHRRSIAASLVQGVYVLERDRQRRISTPHAAYANAPPWWEQFHFQLNHVLVDERKSSYFGAIFELKYAHPFFYQSTPFPPKYVVVLRGTIMKSRSGWDDMKLNIKCFLDTLEESPRFRKAFEAVWKMIAMVGPANVWLAGHSLGASIALMVGRNMAKFRYQLETYLFNPPIIVLPIEKMITNEKLKHGVRIGSSFLKAGIATVVNRRYEHPEEDSFVVLSAWTPYIFVNPSDTICAEFIGYFEHREKMKDMGIGGIESVAMRYSSGSLFYGIIGRDSEPLHLLPTAYMTKNISPSQDFRQAHGIEQWWQNHFYWQSKLYKLK